MDYEGKIIDASTPVTNARLAKLIREFHKDKSDEFRTKILFEIVMNAHFIMPVIFKPDSNEVNINSILTGKNEFIPLISINEELKNLYAAFTDWTELHKWQNVDNQLALILYFDDYISLIEKREDSQGIIINPFGESIVLDKAMMKDLKEWRDNQIVSITNDIL